MPNPGLFLDCWHDRCTVTAMRKLIDSFFNCYYFADYIYCCVCIIIVFFFDVSWKIVQKKYNIVAVNICQKSSLNKKIQKLTFSGYNAPVYFIILCITPQVLLLRTVVCVDAWVVCGKIFHLKISLLIEPLPCACDGGSWFVKCILSIKCTLYLSVEFCSSRA